jgi:hypothetical protein
LPEESQGCIQPTFISQRIRPILAHIVLFQEELTAGTNKVGKPKQKLVVVRDCCGIGEYSSVIYDVGIVGVIFQC